MSQVTEGECKQVPQAENYLPLLTLAKRDSDEFHNAGDGDMSSTKLKTVKIERD